MTRSAETARVKYLGRKPYAVDTINGTGVVWNGNGDVQVLPIAHAEKLAKQHPDAWSIVDTLEAGNTEARQAVEALRKLGGDMSGKMPEAASTAAVASLAAVAAGRPRGPKKASPKKAETPDFQD